MIPDKPTIADNIITNFETFFNQQLIDGFGYKNLKVGEAGFKPNGDYLGNETHKEVYGDDKTVEPGSETFQARIHFSDKVNR